MRRIRQSPPRGCSGQSTSPVSASPESGRTPSSPTSGRRKPRGRRSARDVSHRAWRQASAASRSGQCDRGCRARPTWRASSPTSGTTSGARISRSSPRISACSSPTTSARWRSGRATPPTRVSRAGDVPQSDLTQSELALATSENDLVGGARRGRGHTRGTERAARPTRGHAPHAARPARGRRLPSAAGRARAGHGVERRASGARPAHRGAGGAVKVAQSHCGRRTSRAGGDVHVRRGAGVPLWLARQLRRDAAGLHHAQGRRGVRGRPR